MLKSGLVKITIRVSDQSKMKFLMDLLSNFPFVTIEEQVNGEGVRKSGKSNLSRLAGIWKGRDVDLTTIREAAWKRKTSKE